MIEDYLTSLTSLMPVFFQIKEACVCCRIPELGSDLLLSFFKLSKIDLCNWANHCRWCSDTACSECEAVETLEQDDRTVQFVAKCVRPSKT